MDKFLQSSLKLQVSEEGRGDTHTHTFCLAHWCENGRKVFARRFFVARLRDDKGNVFRRAEHPHKCSPLATLHTISLLN